MPWIFSVSAASPTSAPAALGFISFCGLTVLIGSNARHDEPIFAVLEKTRILSRALQHQPSRMLLFLGDPNFHDLAF